MKRLLLLLLAAGYSDYSLALAGINDGLAAYYHFEGNAIDSSGNNLNGTLPNAAFGTGRFGQALSTTGAIDSYAEVQPNALLSPSNAVSMSLWFKVRRFPNWHSALVYKASTTPTSVGFTDRAYSLWVFNDGHFELTSTAVGDSSQTVCFTPSGLVTTNVFWHVVGVVDSTAETMKVYLNSQLVGTRSYSPAGIRTGNFPLRLGGPFFTLSDQSGLDGVLDEVRIYNRALSALEVQQLYTHIPHPPCPLRATASAAVANGSVVGATIVNGGCGYTNAPWVLIQGGGGTGATATAIVSNGAIAEIVITSQGIGYTSSPSIYIYAPSGPQVGLAKAVKPVFSDLLVGTNYQLQLSEDLSNWTDEAEPFRATNAIMAFPQYWDVEHWNSLYFRVVIAPE